MRDADQKSIKNALLIRVSVFNQFAFVVFAFQCISLSFRFCRPFSPRRFNRRPTDQKSFHDNALLRIFFSHTLSPKLKVNSSSGTLNTCYVIVFCGKYFSLFLFFFFVRVIFLSLQIIGSMKKTRTVCIRRHISISMGRLYIFIGSFRCDASVAVAVITNASIFWWKNWSIYRRLMPLILKLVSVVLTQLSHVSQCEDFR